MRKELIRPHPATLGSDDAFRFRHLLIRDAAYDGLPKATRARAARAVRRLARGQRAASSAELDEIAGWHLEQAVRYQRELNRDIDLELATRAAEHLHAAGQRAAQRSDTIAARTCSNARTGSPSTITPWLCGSGLTWPRRCSREATSSAWTSSSRRRRATRRSRRARRSFDCNG